MAVRAAVEITPPPDIHLMNGEAVGAETAVGIALPLLERCDAVTGWCGRSEEGGGDHATSYWTLVREGRGLAFDNRNNGLVFTAPCS